MKKRIEFRKNILIIAAAMLFVFIQLNVNAQKGQKWAVDGNSLSSGDYLGSTNNEPLIFKVNNTEKLRITTNGNVGIGTTNPLSLFSVGNNSQFHVNSSGDVTTNNLLANGNLTISSLTGVLSSKGSGPVFAYVGEENYLPKWTDGTLKYSSLIYDDGNNLGVGLTNPTEKLTINGRIKLQLQPLTTGDNGTIAYDGDFWGMKDGNWVSLTGGGSGTGEWLNSDNGIYTNAGNVGINTKPQTILHIKGYTDKPGAVDACMRLETPSGGTTVSIVTDLKNNKSGNFVINHQNNDAFTINSNGNVGIGVIDAKEKLEIAGCLKLDITTPPSNSANGTIVYNGSELLVRKNNTWMTLMYVGPWDTLGQSVFTNYNVGIGIVNPRECFEIAGGIRLGNYNFGKTKGDTAAAKEGTILFDGTNILAKAKNQWFNITDGGTTPPPVNPLWDINNLNSTVFCMHDKVAIGGMTADANLHLMNRDKEDPELKMRFTHHFEIGDWGATQENPLNIGKNPEAIGKLTEMTKSIDIYNKYGNIYFAIEGPGNALYDKVAITSTTIQSSIKFLCEADIISKASIYACKNVWIYGGNGCTPTSHPVLENFYVKGTSLLDGNTAIGTTETPANLSINSSGAGLIVATTAGQWGFNIISRVTNNDTKAFTIKQGETDKMILWGDGDAWFGDGINGDGVKIYADGKIWASTEILVDLNNKWGDFVFEPGYKLKPLSEVEAYIKEHKHLEGIPSATEIEKEGVNLGEMTNTLTQKVEELTLYIIEMNKKIEKLEKENEELKSGKVGK